MDHDENPDSFTDDEVASIVDELTENDLRERSQALNDAQERWERLAYKAIPKIPCPECGGSGQVAGGGFGDICVNCNGTRVIEDKEALEEMGFEMPNFAALRGAITTYGDALADRALPDGLCVGGPRHGQPIRRGLALPAPSTVPTMAQIAELDKQAKDMRVKLGLTSGSQPKIKGTLAQPKKQKGLTGEGDLGEYSDQEMDEMIADAEEV